MNRTERMAGAAALQMDENRVKELIKRIHEYVWARHVDGSDHYDHSIDEQEAIQILDQYYSEIGNRNSADQVYLGILLFERAFEFPDQQAELFRRAQKIFQFYRRVTGEDDWPAVEDRLEDIAGFFEEDTEPEPVAVETPEAPPVVEAAPPPEVEAGEPVVEAPPAEVEEEPAAPAAVAEPVVETPEPAEAAEAAPVVEERAAVTSAAEEEERRTAEQEAALREAAEAFIADLEVVDGMVLVPAGTFVYGANGHEVFLDTFYVDKLPVTNDEYMRFVRETGYRQPRYANDDRLNQPEMPVVGISFGDATQFAKWAGKELPSEHQWEKAARGTDGRTYPWGNDPPGASDACFGMDAREGRPIAAGKTLRNVSPFGVLDTCGNIWEWTKSVFAKGSEFKVVRGGSYNDPANLLRLDFRLEAHPKDKCEAIGFRCVKNIHAD